MNELLLLIPLAVFGAGCWYIGYTVGRARQMAEHRETLAERVVSLRRLQKSSLRLATRRPR